jgi:hypothetical protein
MNQAKQNVLRPATAGTPKHALKMNFPMMIQLDVLTNVPNSIL